MRHTSLMRTTTLNQISEDMSERLGTYGHESHSLALTIMMRVTKEQ